MHVVACLVLCAVSNSLFLKRTMHFWSSMTVSDRIHWLWCLCKLWLSLLYHRIFTLIVRYEWMVNLEWVLTILLLNLFSLIVFDLNVLFLWAHILIWIRLFVFEYICYLLLGALQEFIDLTLSLMLNWVISLWLTTSSTTWSLMTRAILLTEWSSSDLNPWLTHVWASAWSSHFLVLALVVHFDVLTLNVFYHLILTILITILWICKVKLTVFLVTVSCKVVRLWPWLHLISILVILRAMVIHLRLTLLNYLVRIGSIIILYFLRMNTWLASTMTMFTSFCMWIWWTTFYRLLRYFLGPWFFSLMVRNVFELWFIVGLVLVKLTVIILDEEPILISIKFIWYWWLCRLASLVLVLRLLLVLLFTLELLGCLLSKLIIVILSVYMTVSFIRLFTSLLRRIVWIIIVCLWSLPWNPIIQLGLLLTLLLPIIVQHDLVVVNTAHLFGSTDA